MKIAAVCILAILVAVLFTLQTEDGLIPKNRKR